MVMQSADRQEQGGVEPLQCIQGLSCRKGLNTSAMAVSCFTEGCAEEIS